jgi:hypothetical protein
MIRNGIVMNRSLVTIPYGELHYSVKEHIGTINANAYYTI